MRAATPSWNSEVADGPIGRDFSENNFREITEYIECTDDYETKGTEFLSRRGLKNVNLASKKYIDKHSERYEKELKRKPKDLRKFRVDNVNNKSKCTNQFVNNLYAFCGDGSMLVEKKNRYVCENEKRNGFNCTDIDVLKSLGVSKKLVDKKYLADCKRQLTPGNRRRRSFSACEISFEAIPEGPSDIIFYGRNRETVWLDNALEYFQNDNFQQFAQTRLADCYSGAVRHCDSEKFKTGDIVRLKEVLFNASTQYIYGISDSFDVEDRLRVSSDEFSNWLKAQKYFGCEPRRWFRKNVIICVNDENGVKFRRARHAFEWSPRRQDIQEATDYFVELDTGFIRTSKFEERNNVSILPQQFSQRPCAIVEMRFRDMRISPEEMTQKIEALRKTKEAYIIGIEGHNRRRVERPVNESVNKEGRPVVAIPETITLIIQPIETVKVYRPGNVSLMFCDDLACQGMCGVEQFYTSQEPITPQAEARPPSSIFFQQRLALNKASQINSKNEKNNQDADSDWKHQVEACSIPFGSESPQKYPSRHESLKNWDNHNAERSQKYRERNTQKSSRLIIYGRRPSVDMETEKVENEESCLEAVPQDDTFFTTRCR